MFLSKRKIKGKKYFYLEDRMQGKRISIFLGENKQAEEGIENAFLELIRKKSLEQAKYEKNKYKSKVLSFPEILLLSRLKTQYKALTDFFPNGMKSFQEDEFVRYAQGSASVEGNSLNLREATIVLTKGATVSGKKIEEIKEIENMKRALETTKKIKKVNEKNMEKIHSAIMFGFEGKKPGKYRDEPIFIQGSTVKTTRPEEIQNEMKKLMDWLEKNKEKKHPVELVSEFHARFEQIHPFFDGNGRTGREILNLILMQEGYPRVIINLENRQSYVALLERVQLSKEYQKFTKFILFCLEKRAKEIEQTMQENKKTIAKKILAESK